MNLLNERESIGSHLIKISNNIEQLSIATAGFRWQWNALAFETSLAASFWDDGSSAIFSGSGLLSTSSLILNF